MPALNQVTMLGNLTRDPQLTYTPNQTAVVDFGLAVNEKYTGSDGTKKEDTCFIDVRAWEKTAENANKYLKKGSLVLVVGKLGFEKWEKDGAMHSRHRLVARSIQFMPDGKGSKRQEPGEDDPNQLGPHGEDIPL